MRKSVAIVCVVLGLFALPLTSTAEVNASDYEAVTQSDLVGAPETYQGKKVQFTGTFLFTGSDFCYQIRKTTINTRDYFCFALGTPSLVRLYLKKGHEQADQLLGLKKGEKVQAFGTFDYVGSNYNFLVVDEIILGPPG